MPLQWDHVLAQNLSHLFCRVPRGNTRLPLPSLVLSFLERYTHTYLNTAPATSLLILETSGEGTQPQKQAWFSQIGRLCVVGHGGRCGNLMFSTIGKYIHIYLHASLTELPVSIAGHYLSVSMYLSINIHSQVNFPVCRNQWLASLDMS